MCETYGERTKMATSILAYWAEENEPSYLERTRIKEGSLTKGSVLQAYYLGKVYPAILISNLG